jgi:hypothetical protein
MEAANTSASPARSLIQIGAALVVLISAFLPWIGYGRSDSFDLSATFLWDLNAYRGTFSIGVLMLAAGAFVFATLYVDRLARYRGYAGAAVAGIASVWQLQTFRSLVESYADILHPLRDMAQSDFAIGPWLAFAAGITLLIKG